VSTDIDFSDRSEVRRWLSNKPREVVVVFAARAALRSAPLLAGALELRSGGAARVGQDIVQPVFRAVATSWVAGQYPTHGAGKRAYAAADAAFAAAAAAADAAAAGATTAYADAAYISARSTARSAASAASAAYTASTAYADAAAIAAGYAAEATTFDAIAAADADDGRSVDKGASASVLATRPLWLIHTPPWASDAWQRLEAALLKENQDWQVWTDWYRARLAGKCANESLEVARVLIADEVWKQGPRAVNVEIARLIAEFDPAPSPSTQHDASSKKPLPKPLAGIPSALGFEWTAAGTITIASSPVNWPVFPLPASEKDHCDRLDTCHTLARDMISVLKAQKYQVRDEYAEGLAKYRSRLPKGPAQGNILLADAEARTLRNLFAAEADELPYGFASHLKTFLEQHIGLRAFYPEIEKFYRDVQTGRIETPLPQDAVNGLINGVRLNSPNVFDPSVSEAIAASAQPVPDIRPPHPAEPPRADQHQPMPPADPLKELDPKKARDFTVGGFVNALWKTYLEGEKVPKAAEGWHKAGETLQPYVTPILEWLRNFMGA
jgi:hypothetical protein